MKTYKLYWATIVLATLSCNSHKSTLDNEKKSAAHYAETITLLKLKENLYEISSDAYEGRDTGEPGQKKAAEFLKSNYKTSGVSTPFGNDDYFQEVPQSFLPGGIKASENVVAYIEGSEFPNEVLVLTAHYDNQ